MLYVLLLQFLKEEFLAYFENWEKSVMARDGFTDAEKEMMMIARESRTGMQISGTVTVDNTFTPSTYNFKF